MLFTFNLIIKLLLNNQFKQFQSLLNLKTKCKRGKKTNLKKSYEEKLLPLINLSLTIWKKFKSPSRNLDRALVKKNTKQFQFNRNLILQMMILIWISGTKMNSLKSSTKWLLFKLKETSQQGQIKQTKLRCKNLLLETLKR